MGKWRAVHPVVVGDACFERSSDVTYKTVCVVLRHNEFTTLYCTQVYKTYVK